MPSSNPYRDVNNAFDRAEQRAAEQDAPASDQQQPPQEPTPQQD